MTVIVPPGNEVMVSGKDCLLDYHKELDLLVATTERLGIKKLAIPKLGYGVDKLDWRHVRNMIKGIVKDTGNYIVVGTDPREIKKKGGNLFKYLALPGLLDLGRFTVLGQNGLRRGQ